MTKRGLLIGAIVALTCPVMGRTNVARAQGGIDVRITQALIEESTGQLALYVSVIGADGRPITGLGDEAFTIREPIDADSERVVEDFDVAVAGEGDPNPLSLVLALDTSTSMRGKAIEDAKGAAKRFVGRLGPADEIALYEFNSDVKLLMDFTKDKEVLNSRIDGLSANGGTALYEAIHQSASKVGSRDTRRAFVVLTDGWNDTNLPRTKDEAVTAAESSQSPGYMLGFGSANDGPLQEVADKSSGRYLRQPNSSQLDALFDDLFEEINSQYKLSYFTVVPSDRRSHPVVVEVETDQGSGNDQILVIVSDDQIIRPTPQVGTTATPTPGECPDGAEKKDGECTCEDGTKPDPDKGCATSDSNWLPLLIGALILGAGAIIALMAMRKAPERQVCPRCGRELDPQTGRCAFCESEASRPPVREVSRAGGITTRVVERTEKPRPGAPETEVHRRGVLATLTPRSGPQRGIPLPLGTGTTRIGRGEQNQIQLSDDTVSRDHARIGSEGRAFYIIDPGSANGTFVNGHRVRERTLLRDGDLIRFGDSEELKFQQVDIER